MNEHSAPDTDREMVTRLLGRPPAGEFVVALRRPDGAPVVIENAPFLGDGRPMPTRFWLVDAALREAVSQLEAAGGVRRAAAAIPAAAVAAAHARYAAERAATLPPGHDGPLPGGGVGGTRQGVKCLHAHLAWYLVGGDDPVGRWTAAELTVQRSDLVSVRDEGPVAAVDCGTNSTRLLVVDDQGSVLAREMRITRLGEGVDATGRLSRDAMDRTLSVLHSYRAIMDDHAVTRTRVVATSAARDATNADEFMWEANQIIGVTPEVLSGEEEGRLSFLGATVDLPEHLVGEGPLLVVDIGGGSTELTVGLPKQIGTPSTVSLDIGCVRVTERLLRHDPPEPATLTQARLVVHEEVAAARTTLPPLKAGGVVVGLAGTVSTVTSLEFGVAHYERSLLHHAELSHGAVERWLLVLGTEDAQSRLSRRGMVAGREDVIVGGVLILAVIMDVFGRDRCVYSEDDILDGLAATLWSASRSPDRTG
jgi:exopolyphosphatase/guanosine-5'-triphosphate,3'-diphosphate pyrophosphatase